MYVKVNNKCTPVEYNVPLILSLTKWRRMLRAL